MRTRAQAKEAAAAGEADTAASKRRSRAPAELAQADTAPHAVATEPQPVAVTAVRMVSLDEGLYALRVGELGGTADDKQPVPTHGWFAGCKDTEGNAFSLWQGDENAA